MTAADAIHSINAQMARYARYADTRQWDRLQDEVFLPTARFTYLDVAATTGDDAAAAAAAGPRAPLRAGGRDLVFASPGDMVAFFSRAFSGWRTMHNLSVGEVEVMPPGGGGSGEAAAEAVFGFEDQVVSAMLGSWAAIRGGGYYHVRFEKDDRGRWKIADLRMERTYQTMSALVSVGVKVSNWLGLVP